MKKYVKNISNTYSIKAKTTSIVFREKSLHCDIISLGPQVHLMLNGINNQRPVTIIDNRDYGMMNGKKVLNDNRCLMAQHGTNSCS